MSVETRAKRLRAELKRLRAQRGPDCWFDGRHWISRNKCIRHIESMLPKNQPKPERGRKDSEDGAE